jgi:predicted N-acyltransferase
MGLRVELISGVDAVSALEWDQLAGDDDPFVEHAFLHALERSRSVGRGTGWQPTHVIARDEQGLLGALPLYVKQHSYGEYIFDFGWARAAERAGIAYYPKLVAMVPFTPATGQRILHRKGSDLAAVTRALAEGIAEAEARFRASSTHVLFATEPERDALVGQAGMLPRLSLQFHWHNEGYASFEQYLERFRSALRKQVRKERREVQSHGLEIKVLDGAELTARDRKALEAFYFDTCHKRGSGPYLTSAFFEHLGNTLAPRVVAVLAYKHGEPIAGTLNFQKGKHLYGGYWGCSEELSSLHFECCYYLLIERAITQGLARFEAGAQGTHKLRRGLLPARIHSAHSLRDPRLSAAVEEFLGQEALELSREIAMLAEHGPFHREHKDPSADR